MDCQRARFACLVGGASTACGWIVLLLVFSNDIRPAHLSLSSEVANQQHEPEDASALGTNIGEPSALVAVDASLPFVEAHHEEMGEVAGGGHNAGLQSLDPSAASSLKEDLDSDTRWAASDATKLGSQLVSRLETTTVPAPVLTHPLTAQLEPTTTTTPRYAWQPSAAELARAAGEELEDGRMEQAPVGDTTVLSIDHSGGSKGKYFNFDSAGVSAILGRHLANGETFAIMNLRTSQAGYARLWCTPHGGSVGNGHARWVNAEAHQWQVGDKFRFVSIGKVQPKYRNPAFPDHPIWFTTLSKYQEAAITFHAAAAFAHASAQIRKYPDFPIGSRCLFASITDENDDYLNGYIVFMKSLLQHNPGFNEPLLLMEKLNGIPVRPETRIRLQKLYARTYFMEPLPDSVIPYTKNFTYGNGEQGYQFSSEATTQLFYRRLQLFTYSFCSKVVHIDAADMLVLGGITDLFGDAYKTDAGFAAAQLCTQHWYFNAGLYVVDKERLNVDTYADLVRIATVMPRPLFKHPGRHGWMADQDVLNLYFGGGGNKCLRIPHKFNYSKRFVAWHGCRTLQWYSNPDQLWEVSDFMRRVGICREKTDPRIVHFVGGKPWVPLTRKVSYDSHINTLLLERFWWEVYLSDKTVVVAPTFRMPDTGKKAGLPAGVYFDMFRHVVRIGHFDASKRLQNGAKTTYVVLDDKMMGTERDRGASAKSILYVPYKDVAPGDVVPSAAGSAHLDGGNITTLDRWYWTGLSSEVHLPQGKHLLTATIAVAWTIRELSTDEPVFLAGFGNLLNASAPAANGVPGISTDEKKDRAYLQTLLEGGRIKPFSVF